MTDLEKAKSNLDGHSICLCNGDKIITDDGKGISPMMKFISEGKDLSGFSVADNIVGKAAVTLFVKSGIISVYGKLMSQAGKAYLESHGINCSYGTLTENIMNRSHTDICPMEKTVANISDANDAYKALFNKIKELKSK